MKKILVTGSEGEVGGALLPQLAKRFDATGFDIREHKGKMKAIQGDLTNYEEIAAAAEGMDAIVHMAVLLCSPDQARSVDLNVKATANVLQAALDKGVRRVVYCSTVWASGHGATEPYLPIDEEVPCAPVCMYGLTKRMGEEFAEWYGRMHGLETVVFRFCGYHHCKGYSNDGEIDWDNADIPGLFGRYLGGGFKLMNPVDLGESFGRAIEGKGAAGRRFVVGCYTPYTSTDAAGLRSMPATIAEKYYPGAAEVFEDAGYQPGLVPFFFSHEKARTQLGFRSKHDLGDLIRLYKEWKGIQ